MVPVASFWLLVSCGRQKLAQKIAASWAARELPFLARSEVNVRVVVGVVNTQELCKREILFRGSARMNADQERLEFVL